MKIIIGLLIVTIVSVHGDLSPRQLFSHKLRSIFSPRAEPACPAEGGNVCTGDCAGIIICQNAKPIGTVNCAKQTQNTKPYCNEQTLGCDSSPDNCKTAGVDGGCKYKGFYPDILKCKLYYYCEDVGQNKDPVVYTCDGNSVYNPNKEECQFGLGCYQFSNNELCRGKTNMFLVHPLDKKYYVFCGSDGPVLNKCKGSEKCRDDTDPNCKGKDEDIYEFLPTTGSCEYVCKKSGRFENVYDKTQTSYYDCIQYGNTFIKTLKKCSPGLKFDATKHLCVKS